MPKPTHHYQRRRVVRSYFGIVFSVSLILFVVGILSLIVLNARQVSQHVKEQERHARPALRPVRRPVFGKQSDKNGDDDMRDGHAGAAG